MKVRCNALLVVPSTGLKTADRRPLKTRRGRPVKGTVIAGIELARQGQAARPSGGKVESSQRQTPPSDAKGGPMEGPVRIAIRDASPLFRDFLTSLIRASRREVVLQLLKREASVTSTQKVLAE